VTLDPRTPVLVGVGQALARPVRDGGPEIRPEPLDLMAEALMAAAGDAGSSALLGEIDRLCAVASFTWRPPNAALALADRLGLSPARLMVTTDGGTMPQKLLAAGADAIARGESDLVAIVGAEAMYSRSLVRREPSTPHHEWTTQDQARTLGPERFGRYHEALTELEMARGLRYPVDFYSLFESARRCSRGIGLDEQRARLGALWSSFAAVAAENPYAWIRSAPSAAEIITPSASNRMVAEPYTKLMVANGPVDQGAALLLCSVEAARRLGLSEGGWIFPQAHAFADDHFLVSGRPALDRSPAIELAGRAALAQRGVGIDDVGLVDLYSCFPVAVELGADALGLALDEPSRPLTLTGGLTFAGGPGNNYVSHSIATMALRLREAADELGLVTGLSYFASSHSVGLYAARPPEVAFRSIDVQAAVDALPVLDVDPNMTGEAEVEAFTISHGRDGLPRSATFALRDRSGCRGWGSVSDPELLAEMAGTELCGRRVLLAAGGSVSFPG
jgi:acetyl-CoA C-acetyltransferase